MENISTTDYSSLVCNNTNHRHILSDICINGTEWGLDLAALDCVPSAKRYDTNNGLGSVIYGLRIAVGIWCILVSVAGIFGNLLTLLALPYAKKKRLHRLHENWNTSTVFILNLATADLIFCIICLPTYWIPYLTHGWEYGNMPCYGN